VAIGPRAVIPRVRWLSLVVAAVVVTGCSRAPLVLTPTIAKTAVARDDVLNAKANNSLDVGLQDQHETGAAAAIDDALFRRLRAQGKTSLGSPPSRSGDLGVFAPRQGNYPAAFLARREVTLSNNSAQSEFMVFVANGEGKPWREAAYTYLELNEPQPSLAVDRQGFARRINEGGRGFGVTPADLPTQYASFLSHYNEPPPQSVFAPGARTTEQLTATRAHVASQEANNTTTISFRPVGYPVYCFATTSGGAFCLFSFLSTESYVTRPGTSFTTPLFGPGNEVILDQRETGGHASSTLELLRTRGALIPLRSTRAPVQVVGNYVGVVNASVSS